MYPAVRYAWRTLALALAVFTSFAMCDGAEPKPAERAGRARPRPPRAARQARPGAAEEAPAAKPPSGTPAAAASRLEVLPAGEGTKTIAMEFYGLDIDHLLRLLSYAAQVTIVKSEQVTGPITVIAPEPVPLDVAFQILDSVLEVRGFTMVRSPTGIYKVLPIPEAIQSGVPVQFGGELAQYPAGDELRTQVIPLENLDANDVATQLQGLLSENASIIPTSTNSLIITDTASNIELALELIANAEGELAEGLKVYALQYYDATEMADLVTSIVLSRGGAGGVAGRRPTWEQRVVGRRGVPARPQRRPGQPVAQPQAAAAGPEFAYPDTRTNSIVVLATPVHLTQIERLIEQLDRPVSLRDAFFVYPVQNLVASELADLLAPLIGAQVTKGPEAGGPARPGQRGGPSLQQRQQSYSRPFQGRSVLRQSLGGGAPQRRRSSGATADLEVEPLAGESGSSHGAEPLRAAQAPEGAAPEAVQLEIAPVEAVAGEYEEPAALTGAGVAQAIIAADDNTNALLISAPPEQIDLIQQMLEKLDVLPPQVHVRAIIAEVVLKRDTSLGFQWESLGRTWGTFEGDVFTGDVGSNFGISGPTAESAPTGFFATLSGSQFDAVLNALTTDSRARVLSAPSIFTTNNQQATIDISQQLPFPTGTFQTTIEVGTISTSISYRSVGIVLQVTPRVTQGGVVRMEIEISANEPGAEVPVAGLDYPSFSQRLATAVLSVQDGNTVVLGGLMRESIGRSASRVPILGDLPLVGALFRSTKSTREKTELLVFLTPHIVRTPAQAAELTAGERSRLPDVPRTLRGAGEEERPALPPSVIVPPAPEEPPAELPQMGPPPGEVPEVEGESPGPPEPPEIEGPPPVEREGEEPSPQPPESAPAEEVPAEAEPPPPG